MEQIMKHLIIIASLMTVELAITESKDNDAKKKNNKIERQYFYPTLTNICDIVDRRSKVHCYCDSTKPKLATWADCWVFTGGIAEDDAIWPSFSTQPLIEHLIFNVRSDDALTFIPAKALVRLDHIKYLTIQFGTINSITPYAFTNSSSLKQISLKSNKIVNLEPYSFAKLTSLTNLSLEDNHISELRKEVFVNLPNLHVLYLSNNNLSLIHEGCFMYLNSLIDLKLDSNYISVVTREMFEGLENLAKLDLRNNKVTMLGNLAFSELWGLKELMLDNNQIEYISERSFSGLTQLKKLTLSGNKLTSFYEEFIDDIASLLVLDLSDNLIETLSYDTIRSVVENEKAAIALYLDGNPFICNCRLSWIYTLRNETKNNNLRLALERVTCIADPVIERQVQNEIEDRTEQVQEMIVDDSTDDYYEEKFDKDVLYDESKTKITTKIKLTDVPLEKLPCPKELLQVIEELHGHPIQNEIRLKAFSKGFLLKADCVEVFVIFIVLFLCRVIW